MHENERTWTGGGGARPKFYYVDPSLPSSSTFEKMPISDLGYNYAVLFYFKEMRSMLLLFPVYPRMARRFTDFPGSKFKTYKYTFRNL